MKVCENPLPDDAPYTLAYFVDDDGVMHEHFLDVEGVKSSTAERFLVRNKLAAKAATTSKPPLTLDDILAFERMRAAVRYFCKYLSLANLIGYDETAVQVGLLERKIVTENNESVVRSTRSTKHGIKYTMGITHNLSGKVLEPLIIIRGNAEKHWHDPALYSSQEHKEVSDNSSNELPQLGIRLRSSISDPNPRPKKAHRAAHAASVSSSYLEDMEAEEAEEAEEHPSYRVDNDVKVEDNSGIDQPENKDDDYEMYVEYEDEEDLPNGADNAELEDNNDFDYDDALDEAEERGKESEVFFRNVREQLEEPVENDAKAEDNSSQPADDDRAAVAEAAADAEALRLLTKAIRHELLTRVIVCPAIPYPTTLDEQKTSLHFEDRAEGVARECLEEVKLKAEIYRVREHSKLLNLALKYSKAEERAKRKSQKEQRDVSLSAHATGLGARAIRLQDRIMGGEGYRAAMKKALADYMTSQEFPAFLESTAEKFARDQELAYCDENKCLSPDDFKRKLEESKEDCTPDTTHYVKACNDTGFISMKIMEDYLKMVITPYQRTLRPLDNGASAQLVLILDRHASHMCHNVVKYCRDNGINIIYVPAGITHRAQILDVGYMSPFKKRVRRASEYYYLKGRLGNVKDIFLRPETMANIGIRSIQRMGGDVLKKTIVSVITGPIKP